MNRVILFPKRNLIQDYYSRPMLQSPTRNPKYEDTGTRLPAGRQVRQFDFF
jgi:hypothetical protein